MAGFEQVGKANTQRHLMLGDWQIFSLSRLKWEFWKYESMTLLIYYTFVKQSKSKQALHI